MRNLNFFHGKNIIKSSVTFVSILLSVLMLCSCSFSTDSSSQNKPTDTVETTSPPATSALPQKNVDTSYGYDSLSDSDLKELYMKIDEYAAIAAGGFFTIDATLNEMQLSEAIEAYRNDHPEVFWLQSEFEYIAEKGSTCLFLKYSVEPDRLKEVKAEFENSVKKAVNGAPKGASPYELELYVNDYLVDNCTYDSEAVESEEIVGNENDAYGALVDKKAVCEGYSRAFQLLCNRLGIDCINVAGTGDGEPHQWNCVLLDGEWYEVDVTWNDSDEEDDLFSHEYFNLTTEEFSERHTPAALFNEATLKEYNESNLFLNVFVPECTGEKYNYYRYSCITLSDINDGSEATEVIAKAAKDNEKAVSFIIDDELDFNTTSDEIIYNGYLAEWIYNANLTNMYNPELNEECYVYRQEMLNVITVELEYL